MNQRELLFQFEEKYPFLYDIHANGVPIYTCFRDGVVRFLDERECKSNPAPKEGKRGISLTRIWRSALGIPKYKNKHTIIFSSTLFRRDHNRNLAAEWLLNRYEDAVIFEWPTRQETRDQAIFSDERKADYCPIDFYLVLYKLYVRLNKRRFYRLAEQYRKNLEEAFASAPKPETDGEKQAIRYLVEELPLSYATTVMSQKIFRWLFRGYHDVERVVDFWGSARENIAPVISGRPEVIELQHGIITSLHPGYIYPAIAKRTCGAFFERRMLVYGESTKNTLVNDSVFLPEKVEVIGNPRIEMYKKVFGVGQAEKKWVLFASQPYDTGLNYYHAMADYLKAVQTYMKENENWSRYQLAVKLHPRENNGVKALYEDAIPGITVFDNASELYQLLSESTLQITVSSTTLYEAAIFGTPTVCVRYIHPKLEDIFGFAPKVIETPQDVGRVLDELKDESVYAAYNEFLKEKTKEYM